MHKRLKLVYDLSVVAFLFMLILVATHELVHVFQFMNMGMDIESVCILGINKHGATGWVTSNETLTYEVLMEMERQAYSVSFLVLMLLYIAFFLITIKTLSYYYGAKE